MKICHKILGLPTFCTLFFYSFGLLINTLSSAYAMESHEPNIMELIIDDERHNGVDILHYVFEELNPTDAYHAALVCERFKEILCNENEDKSNLSKLSRKKLNSKNPMQAYGICFGRSMDFKNRVINMLKNVNLDNLRNISLKLKVLLTLINGTESETNRIEYAKEYVNIYTKEKNHLPFSFNVVFATINDIAKRPIHGSK